MFLPETLLPGAKAPAELPAALRPQNGQREAWRALICDAIEQENFRFVAQPILSVEDGRIARWELLTRLHPVDGPRVPPSAFLPLADELGLLRRLDEGVVQRAIELLAVRKHLNLSVNVALDSIVDRRFLERVNRRITALGVAPGRLTMELVPTNGEAGSRDMDCELPAGGWQLALDNFTGDRRSLLDGVGLWAGAVKIDSAITRRLLSDEDAKRRFSAAITAAHELDRTVVVTRIPDRATADLATGCGADYLQGFHIGRPRPLTELP